MTFNLHLVSQEARDGHAAAAADPDRAARGRTPGFLRALLIGFVASSVLLDWALLGGAGAREALLWLQRAAGR